MKNVIFFCAEDIGYEVRVESLKECEIVARQRNVILEQQGNDHVGTWRAMSLLQFTNEILGNYDCYKLGSNNRKLP